MASDAPLVSVGLPTYNGERYIRGAMESLLRQDYPNLEIIASDNASTDCTGAILDEYAERDPRIRVIHNARNIGAPANFNLVFRESTGPFFMWAADDDRWEPGYVDACLRALGGAPWAVLASSSVRFVNEEGDLIDLDPKLYDNPDLSSPDVSCRVHTLMSRGAWYQIYGLMRRDALANTRLLTNAYGGDVVLLVELALLGRFISVPQVLHEYRVFEVRTEPDRGAYHDAIGDRTKTLSAPWSYLQEAASEAIWVSKLPTHEKVRAWAALVGTCLIVRSPIRGRIAAEAPLRLRTAVRERDLAGVVKYAGLCSARAGWHGAKWARQRRS